jgi:hypothetical protein
LRRSERRLKLNPNPSGKYSRFIAKNAITEPKIPIKVAAVVDAETKRLNDVKLPTSERIVTNILRINRTKSLVLTPFRAGSQVKKSANGPLNSAIEMIMTTRSTRDSMVKG